MADRAGAGVTSTCYSQCGLRLRSDIPLDLAVLADGDCDVEIVRGSDTEATDDPPPGQLIASLGTETERWYSATRTDDGYRIRFFRTGECLIAPGLDHVEVRRHPGSSADLLPILLTGTVSAILLSLRGATALHASAVALDGSAVAFVGESGRGKSTVAALMCLGGAELVTDDLLVVSAGRPAHCRGSASELRLRPHAALLADGQPSAARRQTVDERLALSLRRAPERPLPLAAVIVPMPDRDATEVELRPLPPDQALLRILSYPRVHGWRLPEVLARDFAVASELIRSVPVYDATIPWGPPFDPRVATTVAELVSARLLADR